MSRYIEWTDVVDRYKDAGTYGDEDTIDKGYIVPAEAEVDGRLARMYSVPFVNTPAAPDIVRDLCIDLTYIKLTQGKMKTEELQKSLAARFADILSGKLEVSVNGTLVDRAAITVSDAPAGTAFGFDDPTNWDVPEDWETLSRDRRA